MKLIELLVKKLGGWPIDKKHHAFIAQDNDGDLWAFPSAPSMNSGRGDWEVNSGDGCYLFNLEVADDNKEAIITRERYEAALAASKTEWSGNGLPPVGMEIEYKFTKVNYRTDFSRGKVLAYGMHNVFMEHWSSKNEFIQPLDKIEFRPIRSEEDKKRDEIIEALKEGLGHAHGLYDLMQIYHLLNNGKIPHIRID